MFEFTEYNAYYHLFLMLLVFLGHYVVARVLSRIAHHRLDNGEFWFRRLLMVPVLGHIELLILLIFRNSFDIKYRWHDKDWWDIVEWADFINKKEELYRTSEEDDVTPFEQPVYHIWVDPKVETYIEWNMPNKALEIAEERLKNAKEAGCQKSVKLYKDYVKALNVRLRRPESKGNVMPQAKQGELQMSDYEITYVPPGRVTRNYVYGLRNRYLSHRKLDTHEVNN